VLHRTVVEDHVFTAAKMVVQSDAKRFDAQVEGVMWVVSRDPERAWSIPRTNLRVIFTDPYPDAPDLRIFFTVDSDEQCTLRYVERVPAEEDDGLELERN
jgi:hypothetical protein